MNSNKENQEISVVGRLLSLEVLLFLMGVVSLIYGLVAGALSNVAIGALILIAAVVFARKCRRGRR